MTEQTLTVTLHAWRILAYLAVGAVLYLPLWWLAFHHLHHPTPATFWAYFARRWRTQPLHRSLLVSVACIVLWPVAVWEEIR